MKSWPTIKQTKPIILRDWRGVNKEDQFSISNAFATDINNIDATEYPVLSTRKGYSVLGSVSSVLGLGVWKDMELSSIFSDGSWRKWNGSAFVLVATGLNTSAEWSFANFKGDFTDICLLAANGVDPVKQYNGSTLTNLSGAPVGLNYIEQYSDRVFGCVGNTLRASGYRKATDWTSASTGDTIDDTVSFYTEVETSDGEQLNAIRAGNGHLTLYKPSSMFELYGYSPSDYRVVPVTFDIGTINNKCVTSIDGIMYILDDLGIYQYSGGRTPTKKFSEPVQWYIDNMNKAAIQTCTVGNDGQCLYVSIPMSNSYPDTILQFDTKSGIWSVWSNIPAIQFANMGSGFYIGCQDGSVRKVGGTTDNGAAISWSRVSVPFTAPSMSQQMRWMRVNLTVDLPIGSTLSLYLSPSATGNDWVQAGTTVSGSGNIQRKAIYFPSNILPMTEQIRFKLEGTGPCKVYEFAREEDTMPIR